VTLFRRRRHQRGPRWRSIRAIGIALVIMALASAATVRLNLRGEQQPAVAAEETIEIHSAHGTSFVPALQRRRPLFILALGSDARPGQAIQHERSDSIHVIGVNFATRKATILGFPRDSWVNIPGHGTSKITTAMSSGGPSLTVATIERLTGIRIDFWILTSFGGFIRMVNGIGPLRVRVAQPMHDRYSGANLSKGVHRLRGGQALAFARDRHDVPQGDIGRSRNQGILMLSALSKLRKDFAKNPAILFKWLAVGWYNVRSDIKPATLLDLLLTASQIPSNRVNNLVVPSSTGSAGSQSVVFILPGASSIYADMRADGVAR
jgi:polyisoprenyl-teichoic acid--peptidoglycan teichoic acid transferase